MNGVLLRAIISGEKIFLINAPEGFFCRALVVAQSFLRKNRRTPSSKHAHFSITLTGPSSNWLTSEHLARWGTRKQDYSLASGGHSYLVIAAHTYSITAAPAIATCKRVCYPAETGNREKMPDWNILHTMCAFTCDHQQMYWLYTINLVPWLWCYVRSVTYQYVTVEIRPPFDEVLTLELCVAIAMRYCKTWASGVV